MNVPRNQLVLYTRKAARASKGYDILRRLLPYLLVGFTAGLIMYGFGVEAGLSTKEQEKEDIVKEYEKSFNTFGAQLTGQVANEAKKTKKVEDEYFKFWKAVEDWSKSKPQLDISNLKCSDWVWMDYKTLHKQKSGFAFKSELLNKVIEVTNEVPVCLDWAQRQKI